MPHFKVFTDKDYIVNINILIYFMKEAQERVLW